MDFDEVISYYEESGIWKESDLVILTTLHVIGRRGFSVNDRIGFTKVFQRLLPDISYGSGRVFETNVSKELLAYRAEMRQKTGGVEEEEVETLREQIMHCRELTFQYVNPFAGYVAELLPVTQEGLQLSELVFDLIEASAKSDYENRLVREGRMYVDFEDVDRVQTTLKVSL